MFHFFKEAPEEIKSRINSFYDGFLTIKYEYSKTFLFLPVQYYSIDKKRLLKIILHSIFNTIFTDVINGFKQYIKFKSKIRIQLYVAYHYDYGNDEDEYTKDIIRITTTFTREKISKIIIDYKKIRRLNVGSIPWKSVFLTIHNNNSVNQSDHTWLPVLYNEDDCTDEIIDLVYNILNNSNIKWTKYLILNHYKTIYLIDEKESYKVCITKDTDDDCLKRTISLLYK